MSFSDLLPNFIHIPTAPFRIGTPERDLSALAKAYGGTRESYREESPQHMLTLPAFAVARTPVSNALYAAYVASAAVRTPITWRGPLPPDALRDHPVADVSWEEANAFCVWMSSQMRDGRLEMRDYGSSQSPISNLQSPVFRLPTEAEWEHAARGADGRTFPWGDEWDERRANTREGGPAGTMPAGSYPAGASPYGCLDLAGNVWEWTSSLDAPYPYDSTDGREEPGASGRRILRGGSYANPHGFARCACRFRLLPSVRNPFLGFRLACSAA